MNVTALQHAGLVLIAAAYGVLFALIVWDESRRRRWRYDEAVAREVDRIDFGHAQAYRATQARLADMSRSQLLAVAGASTVRLRDDDRFRRAASRHRQTRPSRHA
mgnify:FL=1